MVVGSAIGAGILAMPIQIAGGGFVWSSIVIVLAWAMLTITGLFVIEVTLALPTHTSSFSSMAAKTLGVPGRIVTWLAYLLLLYTLLCAYVAGEASLIAHVFESMFHVEVPHIMGAIIFVSIFGGVVFWSTRAVDFFNRGLFSIKGFLLIATLMLAMPYVNIEHLVQNQELVRTKYLFIASPVFLHIFNFHFVLPSLRIYVGDKPVALKQIVITGTSIALILYLLWAVVSLGIVPIDGTTNSFASLSLAQLGRQADGVDFVRIMTTIADNRWVTAVINGFFNVSMTTSFLGVSLGLFDFLADGLKRSDTRLGRLQTASLTFVPPIIFAIYYPDGFILALNYAASFIAILCVILPALMVYQLRKSTELKSSYRAVGNNALFFVIIFIGVVMFFLPILTNLHLLPEIS